jgi:transcriptional regulator with XRE-family HTH domain
MSDVVRELKKAIIRSGMTFDEIAAAGNVCRSTIGNWIDGRVKEPHLGSLVRVAKALGKSVELTDGELRMVDTPASVAAKAMQAREFIGYWRRWQ